MMIFMKKKSSMGSPQSYVLRTDSLFDLTPQSPKVTTKREYDFETEEAYW